MKLIITNIQNNKDRDAAVAMFAAAGGDGDAVYSDADKSLALEIDADPGTIAQDIQDHLDCDTESLPQMTLTITL